MNVTKKQRVCIVISAVWGVLTLALSVGENEMGIFLIFGLIPLLIGWGIWWINRGKPKQNAE